MGKNWSQERKDKEFVRRSRSGKYKKYTAKRSKKRRKSLPYGPLPGPLHSFAVKAGILE